ncbi:hypothetical protein IQ07DRAFT_6205 [Pyrenochaeta sp. DS3sAY3a]|nr:hypothetical protein IQ07DRAFT_6205 [Pyrenochaeta sp. DS3sAY3a]
MMDISLGLGGTYLTCLTLPTYLAYSTLRRHPFILQVVLWWRWRWRRLGSWGIRGVRDVDSSRHIFSTSTHVVKQSQTTSFLPSLQQISPKFPAPQNTHHCTTVEPKQPHPHTHTHTYMQCNAFPHGVTPRFQHHSSSASNTAKPVVTNVIIFFSNLLPCSRVIRRR